MVFSEATRCSWLKYVTLTKEAQAKHVFIIKLKLKCWILECIKKKKLMNAMIFHKWFDESATTLLIYVMMCLLDTHCPYNSWPEFHHPSLLHHSLLKNVYWKKPSFISNITIRKFGQLANETNKQRYFVFKFKIT